jgi:hypothetical protein
VGEPTDLTVATQNPDARVVRFRVDGEEVGVCDPAQPDADCRNDEFWQWATTFDAPGHHTLSAVLETANGSTITADREIDVVATAPTDTGETSASETETDPIATDDLVLDGNNTIVDADLGGRGFLDPSRPLHNVFGGLSWSVQGQRVVLESGRLDGSLQDVASCERMIAGTVARIADPSNVSRAAIIAAAVAGTRCTIWGQPSLNIFRLSGAQCREAMRRVDDIQPTECRDRMQRSNDFAVGVAVRRLASLARIHRHDPPKMAAAFALGRVVQSRANRWHLASWRNGVQGDGYVSSFVAAYNTHRSLESLAATRSALPVTAELSCVRGHAPSVTVPRGETQLVTYTIEPRSYLNFGPIASNAPPSRAAVYIFASDLNGPSSFVSGFDYIQYPLSFHVYNSSVSRRTVPVLIHAPGANSGGQVVLEATCTTQAESSWNNIELP